MIVLLKRSREKWHVFDVLKTKKINEDTIIYINNIHIISYKYINHETILIKCINPAFMKYIINELINNSIEPIIIEDKCVLKWLMFLDFKPIIINDINNISLYESNKIWSRQKLYNLNYINYERDNRSTNFY